MWSEIPLAFKLKESKFLPPLGYAYLLSLTTRPTDAHIAYRIDATNSPRTGSTVRSDLAQPSQW